MAEIRVWSADDTLKLINSYENMPELWDVYTTGYKDKNVKYMAWTKLANEFQTSILEVQRKIHNLKNQYNQENKRILNKSGQPYSEDTYISKWKYFNALKFLNSIRQSSYYTNNKVDDTQENYLLENNTPGDGNEVSPTKKRKRSSAFIDPVFRKACSIVNANSRRSDEYEVFGMYVASELRSLRNETSRRRLKQIIRRAVVEVAEFDEEFDDLTTEHREISNCERKPNMITHDDMTYAFGLEVIENEENR